MTTASRSLINSRPSIKSSSEDRYVALTALQNRTSKHDSSRVKCFWRIASFAANVYFVNVNFIPNIRKHVSHFFDATKVIGINRVGSASYGPQTGLAM